MAQVKTHKVRLSYVNLAEPKPNQQGVPFYSTQVLVDKNDTVTINNFKAAVEELRRDPKALAKVNNNPKAITVPFRDGDTDTADYVVNNQEVYAGKFFFTAKNSKPVTCYGKNLQKLTGFEIEDQLYSGCYAQLILNLYVYNNSGNRGVGVGLNGLCKVADGDRLGGVSVSADVFDTGLIEKDSNNFESFSDDIL